jgi:chromosome segregation protein
MNQQSGGNVFYKRYFYLKIKIMFLEKLEIQGFKSFANKHVLQFPGKINSDKKGIAAIVGPNGSGKSNIADAIRWALGEQSMKTLRAKSNEDVIFSGSSNKNRLGMSEVSLYLNNEDKQAPIDYSELIITRRLYRNGENEYLVNNAKTKLADIQILLAKSNFGQKTYSVIGQGMVDGFLKTTPAERKNFFDEATGVKQYQIKRERSLNKLATSQENLNQARMLLKEIEPRLRSLTKQVNRLRQKKEIKKELREKQDAYYRTRWHQLNTELQKYNQKHSQLNEEKQRLTTKMDELNEGLNQIEQENKVSGQEASQKQELKDLQQKREGIIKKLATINAEIEVNLDSQGKFDLSWLYSKESELQKSIKQGRQEISGIELALKEKEGRQKEAENEKEEADNYIDSLNNELLTLAESRTGNDIKKNVQQRIKEINQSLKKIRQEQNPEQRDKIIQKIEKIIQEISGFVVDEDKDLSDEFINKQKSIKKELEQWSSQKEKIEDTIKQLLLDKNSLKQQLEWQKQSLEKQEQERREINDKIKKNQGGEKQKQILEQKKETEKELNDLDEKAQELKNRLEEMEHKKEEKNQQLFSLQRQIQSIQQQINNINNELTQAGTLLTKYETLLEELEAEIREELGSVKDIKEKECPDPVDMESCRRKIEKLKSRLSLIGGIDPEVENEYEKTKQKYDFLQSQTTDLSEGIKNLRNIIKDLDVIIKKKFDKEFKVISQKFEEYFKTLFGGGSAKIIKVPQQQTQESEDDKNTLSEEDAHIKNLAKHNSTGLAGIDIQATPPGKKISSLSVLSGGEKALTSIALICSIIKANPAPFVVLDEVDAALDEANSRRFAQIIEELAHKTQFILITHNRSSMHKANILYGTTMNENGITKLLSLKMEEAEKVTRDA